MRLTALLVVSLLTVATVAPSVAKPRSKAAVALQKAIKLLNDMEDAKALKELQRALAATPTEKEQLQIHLYLGITYFNLLKPEDARQSFTKALALDPSLELPESTSPKIKDLFAKLKATRVVKKPDEGTGTPPPTSKPDEGSGAVTPPPPPPPPKRGWNWPAWITAGVAVAVGAAGLGLGLAARSSADSAADLNLPWAEAQSQHDSATGKALGANICFGVAGAAAIASGVLFVLGSRSKREAPSAAIVPLRTGALVQVGGLRW
jgi:tetratricopeptide (TPR) repeat protein